MGNPMNQNESNSWTLNRLTPGGQWSKETDVDEHLHIRIQNKWTQKNEQCNQTPVSHWYALYFETAATSHLNTRYSVFGTMCVEKKKCSISDPICIWWLFDICYQCYTIIVSMHRLNGYVKRNQCYPCWLLIILFIIKDRLSSADFWLLLVYHIHIFSRAKNKQRIKSLWQIPESVKI